MYQIYQDVNSCIILNHRIHKNIKPHTGWFHSIRQINVWSKLPCTWHCIEIDKIRCVCQSQQNDVSFTECTKSQVSDAGTVPTRRRPDSPELWEI